MHLQTCTSVIFASQRTAILEISSSIFWSMSEKKEEFPEAKEIIWIAFFSQPLVSKYTIFYFPYLINIFSADRVDNGDPCKTYICHECNRTFKQPGNFKQHMASHNKQIVSAPNFPVENLLRRPMRRIVVIVIIIIILVYIYNVCMNSLQIWVYGFHADMDPPPPQYITT